MPFCAIGVTFSSCIARRRSCAIFELELLPVPTQNQDIWNFFDLLTLNNGKLIQYFGSLFYAILWNRSYFFIFCGMREKLNLF